MYEDIETDFVSFYKLLHGDDEDEFEALLESKGPELNLEVDFYGRGKFRPIAFHSEGHQDTLLTSTESQTILGVYVEK